ncbi:unnamed protein product [Periconia digitata]|uniref:DUF7053 domain-containing protein n=1 Tax=Periconia digitata TaxID=1303443 RepID=A0A9W4XV01_9PLEO|nr:unnamed protein product [Periconia digitata]
MSRTSVFTSITPLPSGITRQSVLDAYHNHVEMIELNPLVVERYQCKPPSYSPEEERKSTWYTIKDKVSYLPGGLATGSVSYHACFHDLPEGLQTHVYAPLGLDIRAKWTVGGSLPGEPKEVVELGLKAPVSGLYIREDVRMRCNIMMMGFVKKTFKESHAKLVDRLVEKAHVLESEAANMRLKMLKNLAPGDRSGHGSIFIAPPPGYQDEQLHEQQIHLEENQNKHDHTNKSDTSNSFQYPPSQAYSGHQSIYSNSSSQSGIHSPGSSHASSTNTSARGGGGSSYLTSPPYSSSSSQRHSFHQHSHSQDCDHLRLNDKHINSSLSEQEKLEQQINYLLPSTRYDPHQPAAGAPTTVTITTPTASEKPEPLASHPPASSQYGLLPAVAYNPNQQQPQRSLSSARRRAKTESSVNRSFQPPGPPPTAELPGPPVPPKNHITVTELPA